MYYNFIGINMESTESPLDVLSRAATMVQGNSLLPSYDEARSYSKCKELTVGPPSGGKWRRERRQKNVNMPPPDYSAHKQGSHPEPIDMSTRRMRGSPPSYSQSVCAAGYVRTSSRPSVITCTQPAVTPTGVLDKGGVCDPVIDEHFRRSLGKDYLSLFADSGRNDPLTGKTNNLVKNDSDDITGSSLSVDDHFAKALGETWLKLQRGETNLSPPTTPTEETSSDGDSTLLRHRSGEVMTT